MKQIVSDNGIKQKEDKEYLAAKGKIIGDTLRDLISKKQAFEALGQNASKSVTITLDQYLTQVNEINAAIEKARIDIQESSIISVDTLPSASAAVGNVKVDMAPGSVINMSNAMAPFNATLANLETKLNSVQFKSLGHKGAFIAVTQNALTPDLSKVPQMTEEEIQTALEDIQAKQVISKGTQDQQQLLADQVVKTVKKYITLAGTNEFLRFRNDNDMKAMQEEFKTLEKFFFMRSYLRKKYGLQIGAIQPKSYPMEIFKMEGITSKEMILPMTNALSSVISQTARTDQDLMDAFNNARRFVEFYDRRLTPILSDKATVKREALKAEQVQKDQALQNASMWEKMKSKAAFAYNTAVASFANGKEIMDKKPVHLSEDDKNVAYNAEDTGLMARLSGMLTTVTGQVSTVEALLAVMRLVLADIREEVMLSQGDWSNVQSYHSQRFMATPTQTGRSIKVMCDIDITLSDAARDRARSITNDPKACPKSPAGLLANQNGGSNALTTFRNLVNRYNTVEMKRAQDARNLRDLVEQSLSAQANNGDKVDDTAF